MDSSINPSTRANALNSIFQQIKGNHPDSAFYFAKLHVDYSKNNGLDTLLFQAYINLGEASKILEKPKLSLDSYFQALRLASYFSDTLFLISAEANIAAAYTYFQQPEKALIYYDKVITLCEKNGNEIKLSKIYHNKGKTLMNLAQYDSALVYLKKGLQIFKKIDHKIGVAISEVNMAIINSTLKKNDDALDLFFNSLNFFKENNMKPQISSTYSYIVPLYIEIGNLKAAFRYANLQYNLANELGIIGEKESASQNLYTLYYLTENFDSALVYYEIHIANADTILKSKNSEALAEAEIKYEYLKKTSADSLFYAEEQKIADAKLAVVDAELQSHNRVTNGIILILFLIVVFAIIIWLRFQKNQQEKDIIQSQKKMMDNAYQDLETKKVEIEKKNKEIIDSIHYARYIQRALQPDEDEIASFFGNHAIYNLPKDIVGGDFYWFKTFGDLAIAIAADCTGHGVPGGFLTVLGNLIIETIATNKTISPNEILSKINQELILILNQKEDNSIQDGMDLAICVINKKSKKVVFSGARNGVYKVSSTGNLKEYKGDYTPVGGSYFKKEKLEKRIYTTHEFSLKKGDWVFMYTDGYYDQFGGIKNKSMGVNNFKNILCNSVKQNLDLYSELKKEFLNWKGNNYQLDDVLVFGFTI